MRPGTPVVVTAQPSLPAPAVSLGELITTRRRGLGHSQRDLADLICAVSGRPTITRCEISRYERERRIPSPTIQEHLATALDLPVPMLRRAARFAGWRRTLSHGDPDLLRCLHPGYLIGAGDAPQSMLLIGATLDDAPEFTPSPGRHW